MAHVVVPPEWRTVRFFELAAQAEAVIVQLRAEQEDLEQLFFRVTARSPADRVAQIAGAAFAQLRREEVRADGN
ncbi:MAG: hypothetical protein QM775_34655 [Pirellulales bacterium]